jgi:peptidoglycan hydrolase CwlO-like protein
LSTRQLTEEKVGNQKDFGNFKLIIQKLEAKVAETADERASLKLENQQLEQKIQGQEQQLMKLGNQI